jgi:hypothetical protein
MAGTVLAAAALAAGLAAVPAAHAAVWTIGAGDKAFPTSAVGSSQSIALYAAGNEYQAAQVVVKGGGPRTVSLTWGAGTASLLSRNSTLSQVGYVRTTTASSYAKAKKGNYPDPLLPTQFGRAISVPAYAAGAAASPATRAAVASSPAASVRRRRRVPCVRSVGLIVQGGT